MMSAPRNVLCGVPQGSILGPLFFILYNNSLPEVLPDTTKAFLYADDTAITATGNPAAAVSKMLNEALVVSHAWFSEHKLALNLSKTRAMLFGKRQKLTRTDELDIIHNNVEVENVTSFKYLGVMLDECLKFEAHVKYIKRKVYAKMKALGRLRQYIS